MHVCAVCDLHRQDLCVCNSVVDFHYTVTENARFQFIFVHCRCVCVRVCARGARTAGA